LLPLATVFRGAHVAVRRVGRDVVAVAYGSIDFREVLYACQLL
jgi:hypothetical protein